MGVIRTIKELEWIDLVHKAERHARYYKKPKNIDDGKNMELLRFL